MIFDNFNKDYFFRIDSRVHVFIPKNSTDLVNIIDDVIVKAARTYIGLFLIGAPAPLDPREFIPEHATKSILCGVFKISATILPQEPSSRTDMYVTNTLYMSGYLEMLTDMENRGASSIYTRLYAYLFSKYSSCSRKRRDLSYIPRWLTLGLIERIVSPEVYTAFTKHRATLLLYREMSKANCVPWKDRIQKFFDMGADVSCPPPHTYNGKVMLYHALRSKSQDIIKIILDNMSMDEISRQLQNPHVVTKLEDTSSKQVLVALLLKNCNELLYH
jgi:hypothetical protein